jgi:hypothetical protein
MKIIERTFDSITGETTDFERDYTPEELAEFEKTQAEIAKRLAKQQEAAAAKAALLEKLGITEDEAKLLLS